MTLRNDAALFLWGFMAVWWAMLLTFTWLLLHDGPPPGTPPVLMELVLALFWLGGIGAAGWAAGHGRVRLEVTPDGTARLTETRPLHRLHATLTRADIAAIAVERSTDSDGDPYFRCWLVLHDGRRFALAEGHEAGRIETAARELRATLGLA